MTRTINVPFDRGTETFDRDALVAAILLTYDNPDAPALVRRALIEQHGYAPTDATYLTQAAKICIERGIEP